jgi:intracellular sulfur oxidation DsrE/DsrF family protein
LAGSELNVLAGTGVPLANAKFVVIFHGDAIDALLDDAHYRSKYQVANPNLPVIAALEKADVELYVCGQNLAALNVDPKTLTPDVKIALDALIVLMAYQSDGYALMSF